MPVNAPAEYFKAEEKFHSAKTKEDKILALEEMIRLLPRHHGSEQMHAQLKARLAKLKKETGKKTAHKVGIQKEGEAQVCLIGLTNSGKSWLLNSLTDAKPAIADYEYTTTKPEIGMMDYKGVKVQLIEIPATFDSEYLSIARSAEKIVLVIRDNEQKKKLEKLMEEKYVRTSRIVVNPWKEHAEDIRERLWRSLNLIVVYTKKAQTPMALPIGSTVRDFAKKIHKDFVQDFRFARVWRKIGKKERIIQAGLEYEVKDNDVVELHTR